MSDKKHKNDELDIDQKLGEELGRAEAFVSKNRKILGIVAGAIVVIIGGYIGFRQFILAPQEEEAQAALYIVQKQFEMDSFNLVVNGNGTDLSGVEIADEYGLTKAGNLAAYMSGVSYLHLGQYEEAIDYLDNFSSDDDIVGPLATGLIGDAYVELGEVEKGIDYYLKASRQATNELVTPYFLKKAALAYDALGDYEESEKLYTRLKNDYKDAPESAEIEKYISRAAAASQN